MKNGIPLCIALCTVLCRPAAAAPGPQLPAVVATGRVHDNGAQGISMTVVFSLNGTAGMGPWTPPGTAEFAITSGAETLVAGSMEFTHWQMTQSVFVPVTYSQLVSVGNPVSVSLYNLVNVQPGGFTMNPFGGIKRTLTVTGGTAVEGNAGTQQVAFTVAIEKPITEPITFTYISSGGTANGGEDYTPVFATGTIPAGSLSTSIQVAVKGDTTAEADETMGLEISNISVPVLRGTDTMSIIRNDDAVEAPTPRPALVTEASVAGDTAKAWFSLNLTQARAVPVACRVSTRDGSAKAGSDYLSLAPVEITFAAGETQKWVSIIVTATPEVESREEFFLDVEEVQSHTVKSAACTIERFAIMGIAPDTVEPGVYRLTFPAGIGQRYLIEESSTLSGTWTPASALLTGAGALLEQKVYPSTPRGFFRLRAFSQVDPGTPAVGS